MSYGGYEEQEDNYPCYDCGSTVRGHHTPNCDMAEPGSAKDLPQIPGTQYWIGATGPLVQDAKKRLRDRNINRKPDNE